MGLGEYGGITVMIPGAIIIAIWLWMSASRSSSLWWLGTFGTACTVVAASKIAFKGWGVGAESLNIAVISGHAMNTCMVVTTLCSLLARQVDYRFRWAGTAAGLVFAWWFAINCVAPNIHPLSEALAGVSVGSIAVCAFLIKIDGERIARFSGRALAFGFVLLVACASLPKYTAESVLGQVAITLSGAEEPFVHPYWRSKVAAD